MKRITPKGSNYAKKLILIYIILLSLSSLIIGFAGYFIARNGLNRRGEQILKNSVYQAVDLIESEYEKVESGLVSRELSQEHIKVLLMGPLNEAEGTRTLHGRIDLGPHGYFIIYDSSGNEILHPSLEGQNVLDVTDLENSERFLVREQIETGKSGGGFVYYSWWLPHSERVARKISYSRYYEPWDWIVVATAYEIDFNQAANMILLVLGVTISLLILIVSWVIIIYVRKVAAPVVSVARGMGKVASDIYEPVEKSYHKDEIALLVEGYNHMISSLKGARENLEKKEKYISYLAFHDDLSGLPNRHGLENYIKKRISRRSITGYMVQIDIQGLKIINSTLGYRQGDRLLKIIGTYFLQLRETDLYIARTSSYEFTLWMENISHGEVIDLVYALRQSVKDYIHQKGYGQIIDLQLAMVSYPSQGSSFGELYEKVSMAMKFGKDGKMTGMQEYHEDIRVSLENELAMKRYLARALKEREMTAYYQAQVDCRTGRVIGVEALARWNSKELGFVSPAVFIPAIDSQNMVTEFSHYMIEKVLDDYEKLKKKYNRDISLSVNISPAYFIDTGCYEYLKGQFERHEIPPGKLILEITEDVFISDPERINRIIDNLHDLGIRISIDDFGTGYSSLNYLTKMRFDEMKIDKSFISKILEDPKAFQLFEVFCNIARIYNYEIVAEGVETEQQLEKIKTTSLSIIQGFLFSRPEALE